MTATTTPFGPPRSSANLADEALSLLVGTGFTLGLFLTMARFQHGDASPPVAVLEDFRAISLPPEVPPPSPVVQPEPVPASATVTGIDVAAAESPVRIAVSVPILEAMPVPLAPPAIIRSAPTFTEIRPKLDPATELQHIFQVGEVDQRPSVLVNTAPFIPRNVRQRAEALRVVLLMVVDAHGQAANIRVLNSSGNAAFDALIARCVQDEWVFSPAIRKGRRVKCLVQRAITISWTSTPFDS